MRKVKEETRRNLSEILHFLLIFGIIIEFFPDLMNNNVPIQVKFNSSRLVCGVNFDKIYHRHYRDFVSLIIDKKKFLVTNGSKLRK